MNLYRLFVPMLLLAGLVACSSGSGTPASPVVATRLVYTNPVSGAYQLKQNTALSTPSHLVLEVWGPVGTNGCGASVAFTLDNGATAWRKKGLASPRHSTSRSFSSPSTSDPIRP